MNLLNIILTSVLSAIAICISIVSLRISIFQNKLGEATKLVVKFADRKLTDEEEHYFSPHGVSNLVSIKNNSNGEFRDIFIVLVGDAEVRYASVNIFHKIKDLDSISYSIKAKNYKYLYNLIDCKECLISSSGGGMHKRTGIVLLFRDAFGNEWFKDTDNKLYLIKKTKDKLFKAGLMNPGYNLI